LLDQLYRLDGANAQQSGQGASGKCRCSGQVRFNYDYVRVNEEGITGMNGQIDQMTIDISPSGSSRPGDGGGAAPGGELIKAISVMASVERCRPSPLTD
jgi:hypothetical protein